MKRSLGWGSASATRGTDGLGLSLVISVRSFARPLVDAATELLGGDPARLHPLSESRKLAHESVDHVAHARDAAQHITADLVRTAGSRWSRLERPERFVPIGVCLLLVAAAALSSLPAVAPASADSRPTYAARIVIEGLDDAGTPSDQSSEIGYVDDGTIDNTLQQSSAGGVKFIVYTVKGRDTLRTIAGRFGVSTNTLYWANKSQLPDPESIYPGQHLLIPPSNGLVIVIGPDDTLELLAARYKVTTAAIVEANGMSDETLLVGRKLLIPDVSGGAMPTPKPATNSGGSYTGGGYKGGGFTSCPKCTYPGSFSGSMVWPVVGGHNYVSQGYSSGHRAIDIAGGYGSPIVAAADGVVVYAGWKSYSGGGYIVWISHGSGIYTTYSHLSSWSVKAGQSIGAGTRIGSMGTSGIATGPHVHFEVWVGYPWARGTNTTVNPCGYLSRC